MLPISSTRIINYDEPNKLVITKEVDGVEIVLKLPTISNKNAQELIDGKMESCGWMPKCNEAEGFWLREKNIDIVTGLQLVHDNTKQYFLPH